MPAPLDAARSRGILVVVVGLGLAGSLLAYLVGVVVVDRPDFVVWRDGYAQAAVYVLAAVLAVLRPLLVGRARLFWWLIAASLAMRAVGFVTFVFVVRHLEPAPTVSIADVAWLASSGLMIAALLALAAGRHRRPPVHVLLDAVTAAFVAAALTLAGLDPVLRQQTADGVHDQLATALVFPMLDVATVLVLLWVVASVRWRPAGPLRWLAIGVIGWSVVDIVYSHQVAMGTFRPGSWLGAVSAGATALVGVAGWVRASSAGWEPHEASPGIGLPIAFTGIAWVLLVYAALVQLPRVSVVLAGVATAVALARTAWAFQVNRALAEQRRLARTDELTGLANRRGLLEALRALRPDEPAVLLLLDLDRFQRVNDDIGSAFGDELLRQVAQRLRIASRDGDVVARLGSDDFAVLARGLSPDAGTQTAERLRAAVRDPLDVAGNRWTITASVGQAVFPADATDGETLLLRAEGALADAKRSEIGFSRFDPGGHRAELAWQRDLAEIRTAIEHGHLVMHYQPQVALRTGEVVGAEALVRWQHPDRGVVPPAQFLPLIEAAGLLPELFACGLTQATAAAATLRRAGRDVPVSLNVTVTDLLDPAFATRIGDALGRADLDGDAITLELTEQVFLAEPDRALRAVSELADLGVRLWIDDFGTGYSSLSYLRDLRGLTGLKIDRSFVLGLDEDPRLQAIVGSTLQLASALDLEVIAEGVETAAACRWLSEHGCLIGQGYLFSRPVPLDQLRFEPVDAAQP